MLREMMEMCCLWQHISPSLKKMLGSGTGYDKIVEAWKMGSLDCSIIGVCNLMLQSLILQMRPTSDVFWLLTCQVKDRPVSLRFLFRVCLSYSDLCAMAKFTKNTVKLFVRERLLKIPHIWRKMDYLRRSEPWCSST